MALLSHQKREPKEQFLFFFFFSSEINGIFYFFSFRGLVESFDGQRPFPVERLWRLTVRHARLDHLRADHLANKSFVAILFQNVSLQR